MAHSEQTKLQFIEMRAQEKTLEEISSALNVCRRTLVHWNREFADDIADLREVERESLRRKLFGTTHDWMKGELDHYKRLDTELARRQFKYSPTESVFRMRAESRKTIEKFLFAESPLDRPRPKRGRDAAPFTAPKSDEGGLASAHVVSASPEAPSAAPSVAAPDSEISNVRSEMPSASVPPASDQLPFTSHESPDSTSAASAPSVVDSDSRDPNLHDESIVIGPHESARSILERCGVKVPNHPNIQLIRPV